MSKQNREEVDAYRAEIKRLYEGGMSATEIGRMIGKTGNAISHHLAKMGLNNLKDRTCKRCKSLIPDARPGQYYCKECKKKIAAEYYKGYYQRKAVPLVCKNCGKEFMAPSNRLYCCQSCYRKARKGSGYAKTGIATGNERIDIDIYIGGKVAEHKEQLGWFDAREIWHRGWLGGGYAAVVYVDGAKLDTVPKLAKFFRYGGDAL